MLKSFDLRHFGTWARDLVVAILVAIFVIMFLYQPVRVEGSSMAPCLTDEQRIFVNKFVYRFESVGRGDIVVFHYPLDRSKSYIKRVIGVAGDRVRIDAGRVFVNDMPIGEPYVPVEYLDFRSYPEVMVPAHSYFLLGDHRIVSNDSRDFGPVDEDFIYGKAVFAYWPVAKAGKLK